MNSGESIGLLKQCDRGLCGCYLDPRGLGF